MDYTKLLEHYKSDLSDERDIIEEAIATLEQHFSLIDEDNLKHHSRPLAIAYLALKSLDEE